METAGQTSSASAQPGSMSRSSTICSFRSNAAGTGTGVSSDAAPAAPSGRETGAVPHRFLQGDEAQYHVVEVLAFELLGWGHLPRIHQRDRVDEIQSTTLERKAPFPLHPGRVRSVPGPEQEEAVARLNLTIQCGLPFLTAPKGDDVEEDTGSCCLDSLHASQHLGAIPAGIRGEC